MSEVRPIYGCGQGFLTDHVRLMVNREVNRQYLWRFDMAGFRGLLYSLAKLMGDYNAVNKYKEVDGVVTSSPSVSNYYYRDCEIWRLDE